MPTRGADVPPENDWCVAPAAAADAAELPNGAPTPMDDMVLLSPLVKMTLLNGLATAADWEMVPYASGGGGAMGGRT